MAVTGVLSLASMLASLAGKSLVIAVATAAPANSADAGPPTPKEQALIEHTCRSVQVGLAHDAYDRCLEARLLALRADFGPDLTKLSASARSKIDAACSPDQALGRDQYIGCLSSQLMALSASRVRATPPARAAAETVVPVDEAAVPVALAPDQPGWSSMTVGMAAVAVTLLLAAGALVLFRAKSRRAAPVCRVCGVGVPGTADLCTACRRDAAEAVRQATNQRAEQQRASEADERRRQEEAEVQRLEHLRRDEEQQRRRLEEARREQEEAARRDEVARRAAEERQRAEAAASCDADDSVFDPYLALGVAPGASDDELRAAYEEAKVKYDPEEVAHLGYDAKQHFAAKTRAIERAYQMLVGTLQGR
jgi:hypothetical protein